jgi:hypothetical protein
LNRQRFSEPRSLKIQTSTAPNSSSCACERESARPQGHANALHIVAAADQTFAADPNGQGNVVAVRGVQRPAQIVDYRSIGSTPIFLASALALGGYRRAGPHVGVIGFDDGDGIWPY